MGTNKFQPFATSPTANVLTDEQLVERRELAAGFVIGSPAESNVLGKLVQDGIAGSFAIGAFVATYSSGDIVATGGNATQLAKDFDLAVQKAISVYAPDPDLSEYLTILDAADIYATKANYLSIEQANAQFATLDYVNEQLQQVATDENVVKVIGDQTINGNKTFIAPPTVTAVPTRDYHLTNKRYVDNIVAQNTVSITGDTTIVGKVTFEQTIDGDISGSAGSLATSRLIDGIAFNGTSNVVHFGKCTTPAGTTRKDVTITGFSQTTGSRVTVLFQAGNTARNPTLRINNTTAKPIYYLGTNVSSYGIQLGACIDIVYDGTNYVIVGGLPIDTYTRDEIDDKFATITSPTFSGTITIS